MPRDVSVRPELQITATTHEGKPAPGVPVTVRRFISGPPPETETDRWTAQTDSDGVVRLDAIVASENTLPLMMHGVSWYSWEVCANHAKYGVATATHHATQPVEGPVALELVLDPHRPSCDWRDMSGP